MLNIRLICPLNPTGIGTHAQCLVAELIDLASKGFIELSVVPTGVVSYSVSKEQMEKISKFLMCFNDLSANPDVVIVLNTPNACVNWFEENNHLTGGKTPMKIAYTVFELEPIVEGSGRTERTNRYVETLLKLDRFCQVWVPSTWAGDILINKLSFSTTKVFVIPEGFNSCFYHSRTDGLGDGHFNIGIAGKFEKRKGYFPLIQCLPDLSEEIKSSIELCAWSNNFWDKNAHERYMKQTEEYQCDRRGPGGSSWVYKNKKVRVTFLPFDKWQVDIQRQWARMDAMCFPSYAEGWGLPIGECMASGIPTFAGTRTAMSDYTEDYFRTSLLETKINFAIPSSNTLEYADDPPFFNKEGIWYSISPTSIRNALTLGLPQLHTISTDRAMKMSRAALALKTRFSWKNSAELLVRHLGVFIS